MVEITVDSWVDRAARPPISAQDRTVDIALRLLIHLHRLGPAGPEGIAPPAATQRGIAEALGVGQGTVSKVARRMVVAKIIFTGRCHVHGIPRRVRAYFLTPLGARYVARLLGRPTTSYPDLATGTRNAWSGGPRTRPDRLSEKG